MPVFTWRRFSPVTATGSGETMHTSVKQRSGEPREPCDPGPGRREKSGCRYRRVVVRGSSSNLLLSGSVPDLIGIGCFRLGQRNSDSLVTVVASDSVGRLPDQNVAQAVGRLPGAAVARDQGQARYISLRGAPVNWTTLSIDGISIVSPEGRDTRYDSLPSAIASQIVVSKAVTPDMTGETIAGNVNIITRSAFDYPGLRISGKAGSGYVELGERQEYEGQLVLSNRFDTDMGEFGVLVSGSYYQRNMITDNYETDWEVVSQDVQPGGATRLWARETENKLYRLTRKNYSQSGRLDWRPTDDHRLFVEFIFTTFTDDEARDNYIFDMDDRQADPSVPPRSAAAPCTVVQTGSVSNTGYADTCIGNTSLVGTVYGIDINQRATLRAFEQSVFTNTLGGDHEFADGWSFDWRLNYTKAIDDRSVVGETRYDSPSTRNLRPTISYNFTDPDVGRIQLFRTITTGTGAATRYSAGDTVRNIDDFARPLSSLTSSKLIDETVAYTGKFDLRRNFDWMGNDTTISFGGQYDQRTKNSDNRVLTLNTAAQFTAAGISTTFAPASIGAAFNGEIPLGYDFRYFDQQIMRDQVARAAALNPYVSQPANDYEVTEEVTAAYAMARVAYDWGSILGGVRVENIVNTGQAIVTLAGAPTSIKVENELTLVYPSLHINYDIADDKKLRLSFNTGAARPDYDQLRPNFTFNELEPDGFGRQSRGPARAGLWRRRLFRMVCSAPGLCDVRGLLQEGRGRPVQRHPDLRVQRSEHRRCGSLGLSAEHRGQRRRGLYPRRGVRGPAAALDLHRATGPARVDGRLRSDGQRHPERKRGRGPRWQQGHAAEHLGPRLQCRRLLRAVRRVGAPELSAPQRMA